MKKYAPVVAFAFAIAAFGMVVWTLNPHHHIEATGAYLGAVGLVVAYMLADAGDKR